MTVFKTFLRILNRNKFIIIMYTSMLILFGGINMSSSENSISFTAQKPKIHIVNYDKNEGITKNFIKYISDNSKDPKIKNNDSAIDDALFYQDVDYVIYIPNNYNQDFINGLNPSLDIKKSSSANSTYANMIVNKYLKVANIYQKQCSSIDEIITKTNESLNQDVSVKINTKLDTNSLTKATFYFNFESYSVLACLIYIISLILSTFNSETIRKRTIISSTNYKKNNAILLFSSCLLSFVIWLLYLIMAYFLIGDTIISKHGFIYAINSLIFTISAATLSIFIASIVTKKEAINGIVNVVALGSSFLCGAFVPVRWLPESVLKIAHIFPTYYYINTNEKITSLEVIDIDTLTPIIINSIIMVIFSIVFIILTNVVVRRKRKIG